MKKCITGLLICLSCICSCRKEDKVLPPAEVIPPLSAENGEMAVKWATTTLFTIRNSAGNTPTFTSRTLAYMGLAMYESLVWSNSGYSTLSGQLNGLVLPKPQQGKPYQWIISMNAAEQSMLKYLYTLDDNAPRFVYDSIDATAETILEKYSAGLTAETINSSAEFGRDIAEAIYNWSLTDGGDKAYKRNYEPTFVFPVGPSFWVPPTRGQSKSIYPLHPHWNTNRTFVRANAMLPIPSIVPFSTDPSSAYYKLYRDVYDKDKVLTQEEMEIAAWWGDDPTESFSPPGHSYYLAGLAINASNASIMKAAETYAKTGIATADAFINCWKVKMTYFNERPSTYITKYIDGTFRQYWPEPPFPAFSSGHATQAAAVATVLTGIYGNQFVFTDDLHVGQRRIDDPRFLSLVYPARKFNSFWEFANECANSRFLGGIHTRQDNDVGIAQGTIVGQNINSLNWRK